jgi:hypothetical protein
MSERIRLEKEMVLRLFCTSCQGYRSVHRALQQGHWTAFQTYYSPEKREAIRRDIKWLVNLTFLPCRDLPPLNADAMSRITPSLGLFRVLFGRWFSRRKRTWQFAVEEIRFLTSRLQHLLDLLDQPERPPAEELISLRIDLCNCSGIFEMHCYGLPELERARYIEHFDQTEWVPHWRLREILGETEMARSSSPTTQRAG